MPIRRFLTEPTDLITSDLQVLHMNFGVTVAAAQMFEDVLGQLIVASEANGMLVIDRVALGDESILDRCIGPNLKMFEGTNLWDRKTLKLLKKVNAQRNLLVHRFMRENFSDMVSPTGRESVNDKLFRIYTNISLALDIATHFRNVLFAQIGFDETRARKQINELLGAVVDCDLVLPENGQDGK